MDKEKAIQILTKSYNEQKETIYIKHCVRNISEIENHQEELLSLNEPLPAFIEGCIDDYYKIMD